MNKIISIIFLNILCNANTMDMQLEKKSTHDEFVGSILLDDSSHEEDMITVDLEDSINNRLTNDNQSDSVMHENKGCWLSFKKGLLNIIKKIGGCCICCCSTFFLGYIRDGECLHRSGYQRIR